MSSTLKCINVAEKINFKYLIIRHYFPQNVLIISCKKVMEVHTSKSEEIHQYNIAITRCHEINGCVEEILFSLKNLQAKFTIPTSKQSIKTRIVNVKKPRKSSTTHSKQKKQVSKSDIQKVEKTVLSRRSVHLIAQMSSEFILKSIKIKRDFEGSIKHLQFIREKYDRKIRFYAAQEWIQTIFIQSKSICKCLSRQREK